MSKLMGMVLIAAAMFFANYKFVDMWYHERGGLRWFWLSGRVSRLLLISRCALAIAIILVLLTPFIPHFSFVGIFAAALFLIHITILGVIAR